MRKKINLLGAASLLTVALSVHTVQAQWALTGNSGTTPGTNFIGTTDAKNLQIKTNNAVRVTVSSAGNVGIGNTNPSTRLHVTGSARITGSLGIGVTNPPAKLSVNGDIQITNSNIPMGLTTEVFGNTPILNFDVNFRHPNLYNDYRGAAFRIDSRDNTPTFSWLYRPKQSTVEKIYMVLDSAGNLFLNDVNPGSYAGAKFGVKAPTNAIIGIVTNNITQAVTGIANGTNSYGIYGVSSGGYAGYFVGNVYCTGSYLPSDEKLKTNIVPIQNALQQVMRLEVKTYDFKVGEFSGMNLPAVKQHGFIAQNLETVFPELIRNNDANEKLGQQAFKSVNYIGMIPVLTAAMQEQEKQLQAKEASLNELKNSNAQLQKQLEELTTQMQKFETALSQCCLGLAPTEKSKALHRPWMKHNWNKTILIHFRNNR
ncbi:MAG: tail fiber domain-containing protein [Bacteroidetes bacterium]|nr:tail fiber domain-containing protein [Bacteroidota bacterium]